MIHCVMLAVYKPDETNQMMRYIRYIWQYKEKQYAK